VSDKGKERRDVTVAVPAAVNERIGAICKRTGVSKRRTVRILLEFALPTYETVAGVTVDPLSLPTRKPDDDAAFEKSML
jgi:hypothetical protein